MMVPGAEVIQYVLNPSLWGPTARDSHPAQVLLVDFPPSTQLAIVVVKMLV